MTKSVSFLFLSIVFINIIFNGQFQLHYDEAYYYAWSQHLALSYFDHPPMIAYMIRLCTLFSHSEFFVRLPALLSTTVTAYVMFRLAKKIFNNKVANITLILALSWPLLEGNFFIVTPDAPLNMFWALTLSAFYIGVFEGRKWYIYLAGLCAGFALLSKYTAVLIFPGLFLFLLFSKNYRHWLLKKELYLALILSILIFSPVLIWNYQHHFVSFIFQVKHGYDNISHFRFSSFGDYITSQIGVANPITMMALLYYLIRYNKVHVTDDKLAFLFWPFIFCMLVFLHASFYNFVGANWTEPGVMSGIIILAFWLDKFERRWVYIFSLILITVAIAIVKLPAVFLPVKVAKRISATSMFYANDLLANALKPYLNDNPTILACDYGNASRIAYYLNYDIPHDTHGDKHTIKVLDKFKYSNQYQYWNNGITYPIPHAIFVCDVQFAPNMSILKTYFHNVTLVKEVKVATPLKQERDLYIYNASN